MSATSGRRSKGQDCKRKSLFYDPARGVNQTAGKGLPQNGLAKKSAQEMRLDRAFASRFRAHFSVAGTCYLPSQNRFGTARLIRYVFSYVRQFAIQNFAEHVKCVRRNSFIFSQSLYRPASDQPLVTQRIGRDAFRFHRFPEWCIRNHHPPPFT